MQDYPGEYSDYQEFSYRVEGGRGRLRLYREEIVLCKYSKEQRALGVRW